MGISSGSGGGGVSCGGLRQAWHSPGAWRRALEGELWRLEQAWRDAEEIAAISDSLLLPKGTARFLSRHSNHDEGA